MSPELQELLLKALYSGHKYHLAVQTQMDAITQGIHDTPVNDKLVGKYYREWKAFTAQAVELHQKESDENQSTT